jgi:hypothetical protein
LINQNNRNNWVEWFKCPFDLAMAGSGIANKKTYYSCLADLCDWSLIEYRKGINEYKAPLIKVVVLNRTSTDTASVPQSEPQGIPLPTPQDIPLPTPLPTHIYKLITNNLKQITDNYEDFERFILILGKPIGEKTLPEDKYPFIDFWNLYDKKVDRQSAERKYSKLSQAEKEKIFAHIPKYKNYQPDPIFRKNPDTYLNNRSWNDELPVVKKAWVSPTGGPL